MIGCQANGPTEMEVSTVLTLLQRSFEMQQHENSYWHEQLIGGYQSRSFQQVNLNHDTYVPSELANGACKAETQALT